MKDSYDSDKVFDNWVAVQSVFKNKRDGSSCFEIREVRREISGHKNGEITTRLSEIIMHGLESYVCN